MTVTLLEVALRDYRDACEALSIAFLVGDRRLIAEAAAWKLEACKEVMSLRFPVA